MAYTAADYRALALWNKLLGSPLGWRVEKAVKEQAPVDAIYDSADGKWVTVMDLHEGHSFRVKYEEEVLKQPPRPRRFRLAITLHVDMPAGCESYMTGPLRVVDNVKLSDALNLPGGAIIDDIHWNK